MKLAVLFSLILSILHSILFYGQNKGISIFLFATVGLFLFITILQKQEKKKNKKALILSVPILLLSATYFIFNNSFFNVMNIIVILFLFLIMTLVAVLGEIKPQRIIENIVVLFFGPLEEIANSAREISKCFSKKEENVENKPKRKNILAKQIAKGILISLPILIIVLILLSTADETFALIFSNTFKTIFNLINLRTIYSLLFRMLIIMALTLYFIGIILKIVNNKLNNEEVKNKNGIKIEGITLSTLLTLLNVIYLLFAGVQGMHIIEQMQNPNITNYASYARTGFFQLMAVSIINFVIILISKNNKKEIGAGIKKYIKLMNVILAIFTIIILITSVLRMRLYEQEYGYTFLRLMVYFIQITELILIVPTIIYILKEKFKILNWYLVITIIMYTALNFVNLDYIIAKGNIDRYFASTESKREIDFSYLQKHTSTDAIPEIIRLLEAEDKNLRTSVNNYLYEKQLESESRKDTWQSFNISRNRAKKELEKLNLQYKIFENRELNIRRNIIENII